MSKRHLRIRDCTSKHAGADGALCCMQYTTMRFIDDARDRYLSKTAADMPDTAPSDA